MAEIQCTMEEMAHILKCDRKTILRNFGERIKEWSSGGKMSLRREQMKLAMEGNATMLIWLGKQMLGQTDKAENHNDQTIIIKEKILDTSPVIENRIAGTEAIGPVSDN